ncbi:MAG: divergent PAP2 family protein [Patescibacteria group bacterium]|nr:divergent PAP2 family protein [Patescibacteria group bacterium]
MQNVAIVLIPLFVGIITQITKVIIYTIRHGLNWSYFLTHGHMPSMHSALVTSLVIIVGYTEGIHTAIFSFSVVFALIILDDALRVRMHLGDQGRYLNMLIETLNLNKKKYPRLKERMGHRLSEVIVGITYGAAQTMLFIYLLKTFWVF